MRHRDLTRLSVRQLATVCRMARETVAKRLRDAGLGPVAEDGRTIWYDPRDAIPILLGAGEGLSPIHERAKLDRVRAERVEHDTRALLDGLIEAAGIDRAKARLAQAVAEKFESLPAQLAPALAHEREPARCCLLVGDAIHRALHALADGAEESAPDTVSSRAEGVMP